MQPTNIWVREQSAFIRPKEQPATIKPSEQPTNIIARKQSAFIRSREQPEK